MDRGDDTQRDPRDPGSPEAGAPVWSRQWALSWLKATPVVRALWRAERESPPDGGSQRRVASPPAHQSQDPPSPSTPQPATTAGEAASHETETPLDIRPRLPRRIDLELPCPLPVEAEPWSPIATERTPQNRAERNEVLLPAENRRPASPRGPTPKLPRFNGTSSLEAFLAQFELFAADLSAPSYLQTIISPYTPPLVPSVPTPPADYLYPPLLPHFQSLLLLHSCPSVAEQPTHGYQDCSDPDHQHLLKTHLFRQHL
ncbi:UNVERIFIED_CONTAM: hypothetical protein FKN15_015080 [Acipenser sinensis]